MLKAEMLRAIGLTIGIVGTGRIGSAVIDRLRGFGCRLLGHDRSASGSVPHVPLDELLRETEVPLAPYGKFGFGLGYLGSVVVIATGQYLLGNTLAALQAVSTAATRSRAT